MNKRINMMLAASLVVAASMSAHAFATRRGADYDDNAPTHFIVDDRLKSSQEVVTGRWHENLDMCRAFAEANGIPLIAVWSNGDNCGHCKKWENNAISDAFIEWMKTSGIVFYFGYFADPGKGATLGEWCYWAGRGNPMGQTLPLVRLYWPKGGVDFSANGDTVDGNKGRCTINSTTPRADDPYYVPGDYGTYNPGGRYMIEYIKKAFAKYDGSGASSYYGGEFTALNNRYAGLQVVAGVTQTLNIPLWRTNSTSSAKAYTNTLWGQYPDGGTFTNTISWTAGKVSHFVTIDITRNNRVKATDAGKTIRFVLYDEKKKKVSESSAFIVSADAYPNSPGNPLWIGERTKDSLEFGEWTMDIDAVTNKVREWNARLPKATGTGNTSKRAYSLIYVGGSRWCPDCAMADKYVLETEKFKEWAQRSNVALGVIDIPSDPTVPDGSASLLTYHTFKASDNFVTGRGAWAADETQRYQGGAPYLSRKNIPISGNNGINATDIAKRNRALVSQNTLNKGWNRPERANQTRTGVPCFIALRDDGTIAGRWEFFSDRGPTAWSDGYLKRLEELLSQADSNEEANQNWRTTKQTIAKRGTSAWMYLSNSDLVDTYKIDEAAVGQTVSFRISSAYEIDGSLKIVQASDALEKTLAETSGKFSNGIEVTAEIPSKDCYLVVAADVTASSKPASPKSSILSATRTGSTVCSYNITSSNVVVPDDSPNTETLNDGSNKVTIKVTEGESYKITNVDESTIGDVFDKGVGDDIYVAKSTGSVTFGLKDKDAGANTYSTTYQLWKTGRVGFEAGVASIAEADDAYVYTFNIVRTGGASGVAQVTLSFDRNDPRCAWVNRLDELGQTSTIFEFNKHEWSATNKDKVVLEWESGNADPKSIHIKINPNNNADGELKLVFSLTKGASDAGLGISEFELTIRDNDLANPGTLAITGANPECQKAGVLLAKAESDVEIAVGRFGGSDGIISGTLSASAGSFAGAKTAILEWNSRESGEKTAVLRLPAYTKDTVWVTLSAHDGARTDPSAKALAITLAQTTAISFVQDEVAIADAVRYVPISPLAVAVKDPGGIEWRTVSVKKFAGSLPPGVSWYYDTGSHSVKIEGVPTASGSYVASYRVYKGSEAGMALTVMIDVADPMPASFVAQTYSDVPVMDLTTTKLAGVMTVTVPSSGHVSAKYRSTDGRTVAYSAENWSELKADGTYVANLCDVTDTNETMVVSMNTNGTVSVTFTDPDASNDEYAVATSSGKNFNPANWSGYYTVNLKQLRNVTGKDPFASGDGYALLNMNSTASIAMGRMVYAGVLPNGKAFSGAASLLPGVFDDKSGEYASALLPVISSGEVDSLSGVFSIKPYARTEHKTKRRSVYSDPAAKFVWSHEEPVSDATYAVEMEAYGGFYNKDESLAECCEGTFETLDLMFFALPQRLKRSDEFASGAPYSWVTNSNVQVGVRYDASKKENKLGLLRADAAKRAAGLTMNVDLATGVINGSFLLRFKDRSITALYRGVIMPGWGTGCGSCALGNDESVERPFIGGMFWFSDTLPYTDASNRSRSLSVKRGAPISIGVSPGE